MAKINLTNSNNAVIGVDKFHFSPLLEDQPDFIKYGDIYNFEGTITLTATPVNVSETLYADNKAIIVYTAVSGVDVTLDRAVIPNETAQLLLGGQMDGAIRYINSNTAAPYVGIAWRQRYDDNSYGFVKLFKGKFQEPERSASTKADGVEFQTASITGSFAETSYKHINTDNEEYPLMMISVDEFAEQYTNEGDTWFDELYPTSAPKWVTGKEYGIGNHVSNEDKFYKAKKTHVAAATFAEDEDNWTEIV